MGFASLLGLAGAGIPAWFLPTFRAEAVLDAIETRRASIFVGVPAMYRMLLEAGAEHRDLSSVRVFMSGADVMPQDLAATFKRMGSTATVLGRPVGEAAFVEGYGMVESAGGAAVRFSPPGFSLPFVDGVGLPLPGYRFKVVDDLGREVPAGVVGELLLKGPGVLEGYHGDEEATSSALTEDGWLRTGDLARRGPLGGIYFAGRKKDVLMVGGYSVGANEVEAALEAHPDVLEAAVVGLPDERMGEVPVAAVRLRPGSSTTAKHLVGWAAEHLSDYKAPRRILVVDDLPRTGTSKVQKAEVRELFT
jgi:acyl-CoA synthetase (AMP-forming)/AMP-acid ligase II